MALLHLEGFEGLYSDWFAVDLQAPNTYANEIERYLMSHYSGVYESAGVQWRMGRSWDGRGMALVGANGSSGDDLFIMKILESPLSVGDRITIGFRIKTSATSKTNEEICRIGGNASAATAEARLRLTSSNQIQVQYGSGTTVDTSVTTLDDNAWHYIEWQTILGTGTSGSYEVRLDGVNIMSDTNVRTQQNSNVPAQAFHLRSTSSTGGTSYDEATMYDDWYVLDDSGSVNTDFLGPITIHHRQIKVTGTDTDFTTFGGASNAASGVNNIQLEAGDNYGIDSANTSTNTSTFIPYQTFGTSTNIYGIRLTSRVKTEKSYEVFKFKHIVDSGVSTDSVTQRGIYDKHGFLTKMSLFDTDPDTGAAWTVNGFNGAEFGLEII